MNAADLSVSQCQSELQRLYKEVENVVAQRRRENSDSATADFLEEWNSSARQEKHLPISVELVSKRFVEEGRPDVKFCCPHGPTTGDSPRYLLLMAGFSVEQLVLSMAFHYRRATKQEQPLAGFVPFIGEGAWNQIEGDLRDTLPLAVGEAEACAIIELWDAPEEVTPGDPAEVFRRVLDWSRHIPNAAIAIDVTGGQKPMDTGGTYAAMYLGANAYYLDFDEYDIKRRRPCPNALKYVQLALPSAVFSHDARKAVVELFHHRRFQAAYERLFELKNAMDAPELAGYFEPREKSQVSEKDDVRDAVACVESCNAWMNGNYCHESLESDRLHETFCNVTPKEPKSILNAMLASFAQRGSKNSLDLLYYLEDEYWRLRTMLFPGEEANPDPPGTDLQQASDMIREIVVGSCALAEVAVDAVFHLPGIEVEVTNTRARLEFGNSDAKAKTIQKETECVAAHQQAVARLLTGTRLPVHRIPFSNTGPKTSLIRGENVKLRILLPPNEIVASLKSGDDNLTEVFRGEFNGNRSVDPHGKVIELTLNVRIKGQTLLQVTDGVWEQHWGGFGKVDERQPKNWMANRNAVAHMRANATKAQLKIARDAIKVYLPLFLGVLTILSGDSPQLPITDDAAREAGSGVIRRPCGPWHTPNKNEAMLRKRLRLPQ